MKLKLVSFSQKSLSHLVLERERVRERDQDQNEDRVCCRIFYKLGFFISLHTLGSVFLQFSCWISLKESGYWMGMHGEITKKSAHM